MIYRIHVSLRESQPVIWRRIELSSKTTLKQFHRILQIAMGWEAYLLHQFAVVFGILFRRVDLRERGRGDNWLPAAHRWRTPSALAHFGSYAIGVHWLIK